MTLLKFIRKLTFCGEPKTKRNISDVKVHSHTFRMDPDSFLEFKADFPEDIFLELKTTYNERFNYET
mgnify:CR=1 FL=1